MLKVEIPTTSETQFSIISAPDATITLSAETLSLIRDILIPVVDDGLEAGGNPLRVHHLMRDFHRISKIVGYPKGDRFHD